MTWFLGFVDVPPKLQPCQKASPFVIASREYVIAVKFDDQHIPDSPFKCYLSPNTGEARKLEVAAFPDAGLQVWIQQLLRYGFNSRLSSRVRSAINAMTFYSRVAG